MEKQIFFLRTFLKHPKETGSITPSSRFLVANMLKGLDFKSAKCIIEYGPGTGCITTEILKRSRKDAKILCFETNKKFCNYLKKSINDPRLMIINDTAENIHAHLRKFGISEADYVISGLPFSNLPKAKKNVIIKETKNALKPDGKFITYQYMNNLKNLLYNHFSNISTKFITLNIPPCFIYTCEK